MDQEQNKPETNIPEAATPDLTTVTTSATPDTTPVTPVAPVKKSKKLLIITVGVLAVLLMTGAVVAAMLLLNKKDTAVAPTSTTTPTASTATTLSASDLVTKLKPSLTGTSVGSADNKTYTFKTPSNSLPESYAAQALKLDGYDFYNYASKNYGMTSEGTKAVRDADIATLRAALVANSLTEKVGLDESGLDSTVSFGADYTSDTLACTLYKFNTYPAKDTSTNLQTNLACADKSDYTANAVALKPYYAVLKAGNPSATTYGVTLGVIKTEQSKSTGYTTTSISVGGAPSYQGTGGYAALFYTTPDNTLHYFTGAQGTLQCDQLNTSELKKAYLGAECYSNDTKSTVTE